MLALLIGPPLVFAFLMAFTRAGTKQQWMAGLVGIAVVQCIAVALLAPSPELKNIGWPLLVSVVIPWGVAALPLAISPAPQRSVLVATGVPFIYLITWAVGAYICLSTGILPK
jgi:hypothetical protein